jgi:hypothetical protein
LAKCLVVAEVDKIQSFIFRSSRLREVVGASHLLEVFGQTIEEEYKTKYGEKNVLSSKGGSFRIIVDEDEAGIDAIKKDLHWRFEQEIGGSITITHVEYQPREDVIKRGNVALRRAKLEGDAAEPLWHSPYHAICASSGEELAVTYQRPVNILGERERYLGRLTLEKAKVDAKIAISRELRNVLASVTGLSPIAVHDQATETETYAWDNRQYVAYLVTDGNRMGSYFNNCTPSELGQFSHDVGEITLEAFANSIMHLIEQSSELPKERGFRKDTLPVLPLISGGDDLFVLMPAPWAMHVASEYCKHYEREMTEYINKNISHFKSNETTATTGVAVVICKATYPYRTAYQYAHELLNKAKGHAKKVNQSCLIVDFIVGSDTVAAGRRVEPQPHTFEDAQYFVDHRFTLRALPSRILHQIEVALVQRQDTSPIIERVKQLYPRLEYADALQEALADPLRLCELLKLWDFCYDMKRQRDEYLTEES